MGIELDPVAKLVKITSPTTEVTVQELVNVIRDWEDEIQNMSYEKVIDAVGKTPLGGGFQTAITMTLSSEWQIQFWNGVGYGIIKDGNVVGGVGGDPIKPTGGDDTIKLILSVAGVIVEGIASEPIMDELDEIDEQLDVIQDLLEQTPGTGSCTVNGKIIDDDSGLPIDDVDIRILDTATRSGIAWTESDPDGSWTVYLDPGTYYFEFKKTGYLEREIMATVSSNPTDFDDIKLDPQDVSAGTGSVTVTDTVINPQGDPIENVRIRAFIEGAMGTLIAQTYTDSTGRWTVFLNPETYIFELLYGGNQMFLRCVVEAGSTEFTFEDITSVYVPPDDGGGLGQGDGSEHVSDYVQDEDLNRVQGVHIKVKSAGVFIAEDWSDADGVFDFYLDPGVYIFEFIRSGWAKQTAEGTVSSPDTLVWT